MLFSTPRMPYGFASDALKSKAYSPFQQVHLSVRSTLTISRTREADYSPTGGESPAERPSISSWLASSSTSTTMSKSGSRKSSMAKKQNNKSPCKGKLPPWCNLKSMCSTPPPSTDGISWPRRSSARISSRRVSSTTEMLPGCQWTKTTTAGQDQAWTDTAVQQPSTCTATLSTGSTQWTSDQ